MNVKIDVLRHLDYYSNAWDLARILLAEIPNYRVRYIVLPKKEMELKIEHVIKNRSRILQVAVKVS